MSRLLGCSLTYKNYPSNKGNLRLNLLLYCEKITRKFTQIITTTKTTFEYYRGCYNSRANKFYSDFRVWMFTFYYIEKSIVTSFHGISQQFNCSLISFRVFCRAH